MNHGDHQRAFGRAQSRSRRTARWSIADHPTQHRIQTHNRVSRPANGSKRARRSFSSASTKPRLTLGMIESLPGSRSRLMNGLSIKRESNARDKSERPARQPKGEAGENSDNSQRSLIGGDPHLSLNQNQKSPRLSTVPSGQVRPSEYQCKTGLKTLSTAGYNSKEDYTSLKKLDTLGSTMSLGQSMI